MLLPLQLNNLLETATASAAITGTIGNGALESEVRDDGGTIIITLTNETWVAAGAAFNAIRQDIIDGLDAATSPATGWNILIRDVIDVSTVIRGSDTQVTVTIPATTGYSVDTDETVTVTVPGTAVVGASPITGTPTITVTAESEAVAHAGRPRRRRTRRYLVEIDGQEFQVDSIAQAEALLQRAKELAEDVADEIVEPIVSKVRPGIKVETPKAIISTPDIELKSIVSEYRADIDAIYERIAKDIKARELLKIRLMEEDEEDAITVLLIH